jgi:hypothetical protein
MARTDGICVGINYDMAIFVDIGRIRIFGIYISYENKNKKGRRRVGK